MLKKNLLGFLVLAGVTLLAGCSNSGPIGEDPGVAIAELASLPAPAAQDYTVGGEGEFARPLDVLEVAVFGVPELSRSVRVGSGGFFDYPLIGAVQANGRSLAEISYEVETRLSETYVRQPDVTIEFQERASQLFTIGGEINSPGQYQILQATSLMEAVAIGGGTNQYSRLNEILVFREVEGQRYIGVYDMSAIRRGNYPDPRIYPHDVIMVGDSPNRRLLAEILSYTQLIATPIILVDRVL